jgi:hypothetical protein
MKILAISLFFVLSITQLSLAFDFNAKWIWKEQADRTPYNQTIVARKSVELGAFDNGIIRITADSYYRLFINDRWVGDGPCRSYAAHFRYDEIDVSGFLKEGTNEIKIISNFFGIGVLTRQVTEAGLLAQLDVKNGDQIVKTIGTDATWDIAETNAWRVNTPKISLNMGPFENYDARLKGESSYSKAQEVYSVDNAPWKDLQARDVALMTKDPFAFKAFRDAKVVKAEGNHFCLPAARLTHPDVIEANSNISMFCGMATVLTLEKDETVNIITEGYRASRGRGFTVSVDGKTIKSGLYPLEAGKHFILAFSDAGNDHHGKEKILRIVSPDEKDYTLTNPIDEKYENPWCFIPFKELSYLKDDFEYFTGNERDPEIKAGNDAYRAEIKTLLQAISDQKSFKKKLGKKAINMPSTEMFVEDTYWKFKDRDVVTAARELVENPGGLMYDNSEYTTIYPSDKGDVELCYDFGEQNIGYYNFELIAEAGTEIDVAGIEYIFPDGKLAHTGYYRNSMHYITKDGLNKFTSLKRRGGRYIFITLSNFKRPVKIRHFNLIASTYPVNYIGDFRCSDRLLDEIWDISARTLKLCMEDTYTDCPAYEQTFWVGDSRNEALFGFPVFGATDIAKRGVTLAAQGMDISPVAACQGPNNWDVHLPAWSFLWGISVWDYYWYSGDKAFVKQVFPDVIKNIKGAESLLNEDGLFSGPFWNMFDWSGADQNHDVVLHNTMFMVGAIDAGLKCAEAIDDNSQTEWLTTLRKQLVDKLNSLWDDKKQSYPDAIWEDGSISPSICTHTSFLSILYDIIEEENYAAALENTLSPRNEMVKIGSPFAFLYLYETLEKVGKEQEIINFIYKDYEPMVYDGETTVRERLGAGNSHRSRSHAWSSSPNLFLNKIITGIKQTAPASKAFIIIPTIMNGIIWADGTVATPYGPLSVHWKIEGNKLNVQIKTPKEVKVTFKKNKTHKGLITLVKTVQQ